VTSDEGEPGGVSPRRNGAEYRRIAAGAPLRPEIEKARRRFLAQAEAEIVAGGSGLEGDAAGMPHVDFRRDPPARCPAGDHSCWSPIDLDSDKNDGRSGRADTFCWTCANYLRQE